METGRPVVTEPLDPGDRARASFLIALAAVAIGAAGFAVVFRSTLALWYRSIYHASTVVDGFTSQPWGFRLLVPAAGGAMAGHSTMARRRRAQNVSNVMEAIALGHVRLSLRTTLSRVTASWAAISGGLSIGREGPLIEVGGSLGASVGRRFGLPLWQVRTLVAAGTAAGFAAAYNTPFAAVLFVLETMAGFVALEMLLPTIGATVLATLITRAIVGGGPIYGQRSFRFDAPWELLAYAALGLIAAFGATLFKRVLAAAEQVVDRWPVPQPFRAVLGGLIVGTIAVWVPSVVGNGYEPLNVLLDHHMALGLVVTLIVAKMLATSASVASGVPGGIFTPMLLVGGAMGTLWAHALGALGIEVAGGAGGYALVGMAATAAASLHAPLTAAVLVFELSGDYPIVLPLLLATAVATATARALGGESVYIEELRRRGLGWQMTIDGRRLDADEDNPPLNPN